ncbi:MAG: sugar phosphate isomerase/epimerase family protein [Gemmatimonadota bacterium]
MWPICNMLWRIGDILPVLDQLAWSRAAGFDGIGLHASPGRPGHWEGVDPVAADAGRRRELRRAIEPLGWAEVHAPFEVVLGRGELDDAAARLQPALDLAGDIGARIVTAHADLEGAGPWPEVLGRLQERVRSLGLRLGLEVVSGFETVAAWGLSHVGVTLDVGHMYGQDGGRRLEPYGTIGSLVRQIAPALAHLHLHDVEAGCPGSDAAPLDHLEVGVGQVDVDGLLEALGRAGYQGALCLELNPDRVTPEGIRRSLARVRGAMGRVTHR